jgi:hypothetical protein
MVGFSTCTGLIIAVLSALGGVLLRFRCVAAFLERALVLPMPRVAACVAYSAFGIQDRKQTERGDAHAVSLLADCVYGVWVQASKCGDLGVLGAGFAANSRVLQLNVGERCCDPGRWRFPFVSAGQLLEFGRRGVRARRQVLAEARLEAPFEEPDFAIFIGRESWRSQTCAEGRLEA